MHHYLGMYDITCDKIRSKVFRTLLAFGIYQQKSVFEFQSETTAYTAARRFNSTRK